MKKHAKTKYLMYRLLPLCVLILIALSVIIKHLFAEKRAMRFINNWGNNFMQCNTIEDVQLIPQEERPDLIWVKQFNNGEWVIARNEHACSGTGFDATIFRDSTGVIYYQTAHHYCGYEGLCAELSAVKGTNLVQFYAGLDNDVELKEWTK